MIVQLLPLRRHRPEKCPSGKYQVGPLKVLFSVDDKIFLLGSDRGDHFLRSVLFVEQLDHSEGFFVDRVHRAKKRCFLIKSLTCI